MQVLDCQLAIDLKYCAYEIDRFIANCEDVINNLVENKNSAFKLKVAVHELVVNCVEHGYQKSSGYVDFSIEKNQDDVICMTVADHGQGFDFSTFNFDRKTNSLDDIQPRGWGLLMIKRLADKLEIKKNQPNGTIVSVYVTD